MKGSRKVLIAVLTGLLLSAGCFSPKGAYDVNLTLAVSEYDVVVALSGNSRNPEFLAALRKAREKQETSGKDFVTLFGESVNEIDPNARLSAIFAYELRDNGVTFNSSNEEVMAVIRNEIKSVNDQLFELLKKRIKRFGIRTTDVEIVDNKIHVKGLVADHPENVKNWLPATVKLEFWETYKFNEIYQFFDEANEMLSIAKPEEKHAEEAEDDTVGVSLMDQVENDTPTFEEYTEKHPLYAYLQPSYVQESGQFYPAESARIGIASVKDTARINKMLKQVESIFPRDLIMAWTPKPQPTVPDKLELVALKATARNGSAALSGELIEDARQDYDQNGVITIDLRMNAQGAKVWKRLTGDNIGRQIAIVLNGYVYSYPNVNDEIPNGRSTISGGSMTLEEAQDLANILRSGMFPYRIEIIDEQITLRE